MLKGLLMMSGHLILLLIYGKERIKDTEFGIGVVATISVAVVFWLLSVVFLLIGAAAKDTILCVVFAIAVPLAFILWAIAVRRKN